MTRMAKYRFNTLRIASHVFSKVTADVVSRVFLRKNAIRGYQEGKPQRLLYLEGERFIEERSIIRRLRSTRTRGYRCWGKHLVIMP